MTDRSHLAVVHGGGIEMSITNCIPRTDWFGLTTGFALFTVGSFLTVTLIGAIIGVPMLLASIGLFDRPTTLRGTPCAS